MCLCDSRRLVPRAASVRDAYSTAASADADVEAAPPSAAEEDQAAAAAAMMAESEAEEIEQHVGERYQRLYMVCHGFDERMFEACERIAMAARMLPNATVRPRAAARAPHCSSLHFLSSVPCLPSSFCSLVYSLLPLS